MKLVDENESSFFLVIEVNFYKFFPAFNAGFPWNDLKISFLLKFLLISNPMPDDLFKPPIIILLYKRTHELESLGENQNCCFRIELHLWIQSYRFFFQFNSAEFFRAGFSLSFALYKTAQNLGNVSIQESPCSVLLRWLRLNPFVS